MEKEPALWAYALMKLGNALSGLGRDAEAIASFDRCSSLLSKHPYPVLLGTLASSMGEHLTKSGDLSGAAYLYERARDLCREAGQAQLVCYQSVLLAETLMLLGRYDQAEEELLTALPYMERFNLRREAVAAVALLQVVGSRRRTNSAALQSYRDQVKKVLP